MQIDSFQVVRMVYEESKYWIAVVGFLWSCFKGVAWVKAIKTNDLHHIQLGVDDVKASLDEQTKLVVGELKELRNDFRTFYSQR